MNPTHCLRRKLSHLEVLESESIHILREVAAECRDPVRLFSGRKDTLVLLRLAEKAFRPGRFSFPLLHVDTEHNFPEVIEFRDRRPGGLMPVSDLVQPNPDEKVATVSVRFRTGAI